MTVLLTIAGIASVILWGQVRFGSVSACFRYVAGDRFLVDSPLKSFGSVQTGQVALVSFRLTNMSSQAVRLLGSQSSCKCVLPGYPLAGIPPYSSCDLKIRVTPGPMIGTFKESVVLFTDAPGRRAVPLIVRGNVENVPISGR